MKKNMIILIIIVISPPIIIHLLNLLLSSSCLCLVKINEASWLEYYKVTIPFCFGMYKYFDFKEKERKAKYSALKPKIFLKLQKKKKDLFLLTLNNADDKKELTDIFICDRYITNRLGKNETMSFKISFNYSRDKSIIQLDKEILEFDEKGYPKEITINSTDKENNDWLNYYRLIENKSDAQYSNYFNEII